MEFGFEKYGFVVIRNVFTEEFLSERRFFLESIISYAEKNYADPFEKYYLKHRADQGVLYDLVQRYPLFNDMVRNEKILDALTTALGDNIFMYENSLVYKPKGKKNGVPWHQDFVSRPEEPIKYIAWCAIDPVKKSTGALKVFPGSHNLGFLPWYRVEGETHHDRIDLSQLELDEVMYVELDPGDVLVFNQLLVHGSDEMSTSDKRLVFRASFQNFDEIYTPRGTPIVVKGACGESLERIFDSPRVADQRSLLVKGVNKLGRFLSTWGLER
ncbi:MULTISPECIES: phytanoyl-CoA dioxygenase family protein [unclassified Endozoicomonas]|uniref:phytanoyl-CoA dioxygenase family protein n=1 Tax=unclassified Endozoicomonas TaxID=2644528 RepID=UPI00214807BA|nr:MULTISPECIES: phytanoyl-CoA dioxygenase family protein [unclassified Endozoicomonas]